MKKKLALLLAAVMVAGMVPATVFAGVSNRITKVVSVTQESYTSDTENTTSLVIEEKDGLVEADQKAQKFALTLSGAKWAIKGNYADTAAAYKAVEDALKTAGVTAKQITDSMIVVTADFTDAATPKVIIPLYTQVTGAEEATVTIDRMESPLKNETLTFATVITGSTTTTIESTVTVDTGNKEIKPIIIKENVDGTIKDGTIKLRLAGNFEFRKASDVSITNITTGLKDTDINATLDVDVAEDTVTITNYKAGAGKDQIVISGVEIFATDDAENGEVAEITVSGTGIATTTLEVATYVEYGVTWTAEDKDLPVIYAGKDAKDVSNTLKVTLKEAVAGSWLSSRKTTITFPAGVKVDEIEVVKATGAAVTKANFDINNSKNVVTLTGVKPTGKVTLTLKFALNVAPDFAGDITATLGGAAVSEDMEATIATAKPLVTVESDVNEVIIDYRNTAIGDITITENKVGALGKLQTLYLEAENMSFEDGTTYEVVEGDLKISKVAVTGGVNGGRIAITIKSESVKTPGVIKLSGLSLYMSRSLPAGDYRLYTVDGNGKTRGIGFETTVDTTPAADEATFTTDEVVLMDDFVKIVTAGRDQDDSTFTTTVTVTIGATSMTAGKETIELDAPAYISNGYTMLPVRAVAEALSGSAQVSWDDTTKTVIIFFGSRIIKMTIGSNDMIINGTSTRMSAPAEITNNRTFIPLRDLGYALGLNDEKIGWDDATKTATLN